eukprot:scaffold23791_cov109-Isochrysis_galbana.AAC.2
MDAAKSVRGALLLAAACAAAAVSGGFGSATAGITPAEVAAFLKPELTFMPDRLRADAAAGREAVGVGAWQAVARTLTGLQKLDCGHDAGIDGRVTLKERELLDATEAMLDVRRSRARRAAPVRAHGPSARRVLTPRPVCPL